MNAHLFSILHLTYCLFIGEAHHTLIFEQAQTFHSKKETYKNEIPLEFVSLNIYIMQPSSTVHCQKNNPVFELLE